jgi:Asp-tRNA(Asn)/Glu-tRNA(Gln) amidotransferase A subunit family amidase
VAAFTAPANVAGLPAVAWTERLSGTDTLSLQLIGRYGEDVALLDLAAQLHRKLAGVAPRG